MGLQAFLLTYFCFFKVAPLCRVFIVNTAITLSPKCFWKVLSNKHTCLPFQPSAQVLHMFIIRTALIVGGGVS